MFRIAKIKTPFFTPLAKTGAIPTKMAFLRFKNDTGTPGTSGASRVAICLLALALCAPVANHTQRSRIVCIGAKGFFGNYTTHHHAKALARSTCAVAVKVTAPPVTLALGRQTYPHHRFAPVGLRHWDTL